MSENEIQYLTNLSPQDFRHKLPSVPTNLLKAVSETLGDTVISIKAQIDEAHAEASEGFYSDSDWYRRVQTARRYKARLLNISLEELAKRRKAAEREAHARSQEGFCDRFKAAVRELNPEVYKRAIEKAMEGSDG